MSETPSEVITSALVGSLESTAPISSPSEQTSLPSLPLSSSYPIHASKLIIDKRSRNAVGTLVTLPTAAIQENAPLYAEIQYYAFYRYKSIKVRLTLSAPKNVIGFLSIGWVPASSGWIPNTGVDNTSDALNTLIAANLLPKLILNRSDTKLLSIAEPMDVEFTIPWTYPFDMLPMDYYKTTNWWTSVGDRPEVGEPILFSTIWALNSITPALPIVKSILTIQYEGFECIGRVSTDVTFVEPKTMDAQMLNAGASLVGDMVVKAGMKKLESIVNERVNNAGDKAAELLDDTPSVACSLFGWCDTGEQAQDTYEEAEFNTNTGAQFDTPLATQPSIIGDTLSCLPSGAVPIRAPNSGSFHRVPHSATSSNMRLNQFLRRPQLILEGTLSGVESLQTLTVTPFYDNRNQYPTWFSYFGQLARYWRGSIRYHFVFAGHPFIEQRFQIAYNPYLNRNIDAYVFEGVPYFETHTVNFSGSKTFSVVVPYVHPMEYLPINKTDTAGTEFYAIGELRWNLEVINSFSDTLPTVNYMLFMSAGPDFCYYDPCPPGFYNNVTTLPPPAEAAAQCSLPGSGDVVRLVQGYSSPDPGLFKPLVSLKQLSCYWSRVMYHTRDSFLYPIGEPNQDMLYSSTWVKNDYFAQKDYLAYCHAMFLYWRGSMSYKTVFNTTYVGIPEHKEYAYVTLGEPWVSVTTQSTFANDPLMVLGSSVSNWGAGTVCTKVDEQPIMEFTLPMRHALGASFVQSQDSPDPNITSRYGYVPPAPVNTNLYSYRFGDDDELVEVDLIYRKAGRDFEVFVESLMPYPSEWASRGYAKT